MNSVHLCPLLSNTVRRRAGRRRTTTRLCVCGRPASCVPRSRRRVMGRVRRPPRGFKAVRPQINTTVLDLNKIPPARPAGRAPAGEASRRARSPGGTRRPTVGSPACTHGRVPPSAAAAPSCADGAAAGRNIRCVGESCGRQRPRRRHRIYRTRLLLNHQQLPSSSAARYAKCLFAGNLLATDSAGYFAAPSWPQPLLRQNCSYGTPQI